MKPWVPPASSAHGCPCGLDAEGQQLLGTVGFSSFGKRKPLDSHPKLRLTVKNPEVTLLKNFADISNEAGTQAGMRIRSELIISSVKNTGGKENHKSASPWLGNCPALKIKKQMAEQGILKASVVAADLCGRRHRRSQGLVYTQPVSISMEMQREK